MVWPEERRGPRGVQVTGEGQGGGYWDKGITGIPFPVTECLQYWLRTRTVGEEGAGVVCREGAWSSEGQETSWKS